MNKTASQLEAELSTILTDYLSRPTTAETVLNKGWGSVAGQDGDDLIEYCDQALDIELKNFDFNRYFGPESFFDLEFEWVGWRPCIANHEALKVSDLAEYYFRSQAVSN